MIRDNVLLNFVTTNHTPIRAKLLLEAIEGILTYNFLDIVPRLEEIILDDDTDTSTRIERVKVEIINAIKEIMNFVGIIPYKEVNDFITISKIINGIDKCVNEYHSDYILDNTSLGDSEESEMAMGHSIVRLIEDVSELGFYEVVYDVKQGTMAELETILRSKVVADIETNDPAILVRYKNFVKGRAKGIVHQYIVAGGMIGIMDEEDAMTFFSEPILALPIEDRAYDIVSAVMTTVVEDTSIPEILGKWANYFSDTDGELGMIEREINKLIS